MPVLERRGPHCSARERLAAVRRTIRAEACPEAVPLTESAGRPRSSRDPLAPLRPSRGRRPALFRIVVIVELYTDWLWFGEVGLQACSRHARCTGAAGEPGVCGLGDLAGIQPATGGLEPSRGRADPLDGTGRPPPAAGPRDDSAAGLWRGAARVDPGCVDRVESVDDVAGLPLRRPLQHRRSRPRTRHRVLHLHTALHRSRPGRRDGAGRRGGGESAIVYV